MKTSLYVAYSALAVFSIPLFAQSIPTCPLYGNAPQCAGHVFTTAVTETAPAPPTNAPPPETEDQQNYQTGQAIGTAAGSAFFYHHFPAWRRGYCSKHPLQPFFYGNARGDKITGTCPTQDQLADEAATEWTAKHLLYHPSAENGALMDQFVADNHLPRWEPKSYEKAFKELTKTGKLKSQ